jgi:concentrative nucleoside transporter, CNT family
MQVLWGVGGMAFLLFLAFLLSTNRRAIRPRTVLGALAIQVAFGIIVLYWEAGQRALQAVSSAVQAVINSSREGIQFLFGPVLPDQGLIFAFQVLPVIIFFASLTAVLYHWNILQWVVRIIGGALQKVLRTSEAESMNATANIFVGQTEAAETATGDAEEEEEEVASENPLRHRNVIDAAAAGASDGLHLALNVGAMLVAFISLIALINLILGAIGGLVGFEDLTFQLILGYIFSPIMFIIGVPWNEAIDAGSFLGQKLILNEFVAFSNFGPQAGEFSEKTAAIITFALTGFANFGSLAILLGGLGGIAPSRRPQIAQFGIRAVLAGTLANLMSAAIAGILIGGS